MSNIGEWFLIRDPFSPVCLNSIVAICTLGDYHRNMVYYFLITELAVRWAIAIVNKHHARWWFSIYSLV